ncbi:MAG: L-2-hydroxyglutarate oxidase [Acidobacteria bacterium]|nr:L-2-hydroxyglutarate oxidase [Acidobacteriota bacterium]
MGASDPFDVVVIGGGIVGMATAMALLDDGAQRVAVLEAEDRVAPHQTGHNSGVIHSGLYYRPGSLKAQNCVEGRLALLAFCEEHEVPFEVCGKLVVATDRREIPALDELERRGRANSLHGLKRLQAEELREYEPHVAGIDGLWVPQTGITDFTEVTRAMARRVESRGGEVRLGSRVLRYRREGGVHLLETASGPVRARFLVGCAGLQSDRVARLCGLEPGVRIVPFRGEYYDLVPEAASMVRNLIYPVPDPGFPFLGVHLTRMIHGGAEAGPNAVLAFKREGYRRSSFSPRDAASTMAYGGFWRLAARYWKTGLAEQWRSLNKAAFVHSVQRLVPGLRGDQLVRGGAGVRAQALAPDGSLLDDFAIVRGERMIHVLNAPSPAATASIAIGRAIAGMVQG